VQEEEHVAKDVARFKHAKITASWDIKPKENPMRLRVQTTWQWTNFVVLNKEMDATISFWMKANSGNQGTCSLTEKEMVLI
jgi:hypothetical protein